MPKAYEEMRDKFIQQGMEAAAAKGKAARIFNSRRKPGTPPVTNHEGLGDKLAGKHR
jgi:hypothetical protein